MSSPFHDILAAIDNCSQVPMDCYAATKVLKEFDLSIVDCEWHVGDWVTPKSDRNLKGHGAPHRVIKTFDQLQLHVESFGANLSAYNIVVAICRNMERRVYVYWRSFV